MNFLSNVIGFVSKKQRERNVFFKYALQAIEGFTEDTLQAYQGQDSYMLIKGTKAFGTYSFDLKLRQLYNKKAAEWFVFEMSRSGRLAEYLTAQEYADYAQAFHSATSIFYASQAMEEHNIHIPETNAYSLGRKYNLIIENGPDTDIPSILESKEPLPESIIVHTLAPVQFILNVGDFCQKISPRVSL